MIPPSRGVLLMFVVALPLVGGIAACTAGEDLQYESANLTPDGGGEGGSSDGATDAGPAIRVIESGTLPTKSADGGGHLIPPLTGTPIPCGLGFDGGPCDPSEGLGCCLITGGTNVCQLQGYYFQNADNFCQGTGAGGAGDVFLSCVGSDSDNTCCWQKDFGGSGRYHTRFRVACDGGFEACDLEADGGGYCSNDAGACKTAICAGFPVGYCGDTSPCP